MALSLDSGAAAVGILVIEGIIQTHGASVVFDANGAEIAMFVSGLGIHIIKGVILDFDGPSPRLVGSGSLIV
jgi:hypothetical protein